MSAFEAFVRDNPASAERAYGETMAATLRRRSLAARSNILKAHLRSLGRPRERETIRSRRTPSGRFGIFSRRGAKKEIWPHVKQFSDTKQKIRVDALYACFVGGKVVALDFKLPAQLLLRGSPRDSSGTNTATDQRIVGRDRVRSCPNSVLEQFQKGGDRRSCHRITPSGCLMNGNNLKGIYGHFMSRMVTLTGL
jgi:hypothetical protein